MGTRPPASKGREAATLSVRRSLIAFSRAESVTAAIESTQKEGGGEENGSAPPPAENKKQPETNPGKSVGHFLDLDGLLANPVAEIVQLGAANLASLHHLDLGDLWGMDLEDPLHTFAIGDLPDGERLVDPGAAASDHDSFENLDSLLAALDHSGVHIDRVPGAEFRDVLFHLFTLDFVDHIHGQWEGMGKNEMQMEPVLRRGAKLIPGIGWNAKIFETFLLRHWPLKA